MRGSRRVTRTRMASWDLPTGYNRQRIARLFDGRRSLDVVEVLDLEMPSLHRLHAALREELLAEESLFELACRLAEAALPLFEWRYPGDERPRRALEARRNHARGDVGDEALRAVKELAWEAVMKAREESRTAWDSAHHATHAARAAWELTWRAAGPAAREAAIAASWALAGEAARVAVRTVWNKTWPTAWEAPGVDCWERARTAATEAARAAEAQVRRQGLTWEPAMATTWSAAWDSALTAVQDTQVAIVREGCRELESR